MKVFLIGNKIDLDDKRKVNKEDAEQYVKDNKLDYFIETSAKTGFNAKNVFIPYDEGKVVYNEETNKYEFDFSNIEPNGIFL